MNALRAVVYLDDVSDGTCRVIAVRADATVGDLIRAMVAVESDWVDETVASSDTSRAETDDPAERYLLVEVATEPEDVVGRETVLSRKLLLDSPRLQAARWHWDSVILKHTHAQLVQRGPVPMQRLKQIVQKRRKSKGYALLEKDEKARQRKGLGGKEDFWMRLRPRREASKVTACLKLVDGSSYKPTVEKKGFVTIKDDRKLRRMWLEYRQDVLFSYKDKGEKQQPVKTIMNVSKCEFHFKQSDDGVTLKLIRGKLKYKLCCKNRQEAVDWYEALNQHCKIVPDPEARVLKLKPSVYVEPIPEYTEEEEEEDLRNVLSVRQLEAMQDDTYITLDAAQQAATAHSNMNELLVNAESGDYLTLETIQDIVKKAGFSQRDTSNRSVDSQGNYLTVEAMQQLVADAGYLTVEEMRELAGTV